MHQGQNLLHSSHESDASQRFYWLRDILKKTLWDDPTVWQWEFLWSHIVHAVQRKTIPHFLKRKFAFQVCWDQHPHLLKIFANELHASHGHSVGKVTWHNFWWVTKGPSTIITKSRHQCKDEYLEFNEGENGVICGALALSLSFLNIRNIPHRVVKDILANLMREEVSIDLEWLHRIWVFCIHYLLYIDHLQELLPIVRWWRFHCCLIWEYF